MQSSREATRTRSGLPPVLGGLPMVLGAMPMVLGPLALGLACNANDAGLFNNSASLAQRPSAAGGSAQAAGGGGNGAGLGGGGGSGSAPAASGGTASQTDASVDMPGPDVVLSAGGTSSPGPLTEPVRIDFGQCLTFDACGGVLDGTWVYSSGCLGRDAVLDSSSTCDAASVQLQAQVEGTLSFTGSTVRQTGGTSGQGVISLPRFCSLALGGCASLRALIAEDENACEQVNIECVCQFTLASGDWDDESYEVSDAELKLSGGRTFDYCVRGDELTYVETSDDAQERVIYILTRQ